MTRRNVTVALSEDAARWLRIQAARQDMSVSQYLASLVDTERERAERYDEARSKFLSRKPKRLGPAGATLPPRATLHERG